MRTTIDTTQDSQIAWDRAIAEYKRIAQRNAEARVKRMSASDLQRYAAVYNTPDDSQESILAHMGRWGGAHELMASGALVRGTSALFNRLLKGQDPLPYPPPRTTRNKPWFELFEASHPLPVDTVGFVGKSRRVRDSGSEIFLLTLNECTYECALADQSTSAVRDWLTGQQPLTFQSKLSLQLRFGEWPNCFQLVIHAPAHAVTLPSIESLPALIRSHPLKCDLSYPATLPTVI